jgi:putative ABC transport system permease protein
LRLRSLFRRDAADRELDEELRDYIERQTEDNLARGMNSGAAHRAALLALGGLEQRKQQCRETRGVHWLEDLGQDVIYGVRMMRREPGFTTAALLIIALGIGATTAIFSADDAVLFRVLPYRDPGQLVELFQKSLSHQSTDRMPVAPANYFDWQNDGRVFEGVAAWQTTNFNLSGGDAPEGLVAGRVSANLFSVLGVAPILGRGFQPGVEVPGRDSEVILSYKLWQRRFAGDRNVLGKTIRANDRTFTIVGVMSSGFRFPIGWQPTEVEAWWPLALDSAQRASRKDIILDVVARLRPGVSVGQAQTAIDEVTRSLALAYPEANKDWGANVMPLSDRGVSDFRGLFVLLSFSVGLVLLIACANIANLLLARGMARQKELAVRSALGAQRSRMVRQMITEGILLSSCGGLLGIGLGYLGTRMLASLAPMELPDLKHIALQASVLAASLGLSALTGLLFSVLPALVLSARPTHGALQETGRTSTGTLRDRRMRAVLVSGEVALTLALLLCAGDILNSFFSYMAIDPGFDPTNVLTMRITLPRHKYDTPEKRRAFFVQALDEIGTIPGVSAAAAGSGAPMEEGSVLLFHIDGSPVPGTLEKHPMAEFFSVTPDYFRATRIGMVRGRGLLHSDIAGQPLVALVNETLARSQFGDADPIGRRFFLDGDVNESAVAKTTGPPTQIVGVVHDTKEYGLFQITPGMIYVPLSQHPEPAATLLAKTGQDPGSIVAEVRRRLAKLDSDQPVNRVRSLEDIFREEHAFFRFNTLLISAFAAMALVLSLIGIYSVIAYAVGQRAREFGIRLALGSSRGSILALVLRQAAWICVFGLSIGAALSWPAIRLLAGALHSSMYLTLTRPHLALFPAICAAMVTTMIGACTLPARRASNADPMQVLRRE